MSEVAASVDTLLLSMEEAVNRDDAGAYMALIDTSDPIWATEQRAWVTDSIKREVEYVTIERAWDAVIEMNDHDEAVTTIEIVWHLPGEQLDRSNTFDARFVPVGLSDGAWVFGGRAWRKRNSEIEGVVVYSDELYKGLDARIAARVPMLREEIESALGAKIEGDVSVKVYPDVASLQASISMAYTDPLSGWNEPGESIKILGRDELDGERLDTLLAHEIGHAVSFEMGEQIIRAPWWVLEGIAEVASDPFRDTSPDVRMKRILAMHKDGELRDWEQLADFRGEANNHAMFVYLQGWAMVHHITEFYGVDARNQWLAEMGSGLSLDEASRGALGVSFGSLDSQWRAMLTAQQGFENPTDEIEE